MIYYYYNRRINIKVGVHPILSEILRDLRKG